MGPKLPESDFLARIGKGVWFVEVQESVERLRVQAVYAYHEVVYDEVVYGARDGSYGGLACDVEGAEWAFD